MATASVLNSRSARAPAKSHIKPYDVADTDRDLKQMLLDWRKQMMVAKFGSVVARKYGGKYFLADDLVQRLVDCVHASKISSVESIEKETHWSRVKEHGALLLDVMRPYLLAPSVTPSDPRALPEGQMPGHSVGVQMQRKRRCGKCNSEGHIGMYID